ncbi:mechanosensitive ion channel family protein [Pedomonas mirosovicensis]|uniref:mechanosensitive ion channel family protein n=1 Tax=Pedomonas mirosovicensis TaxID=2908641 RepID=UPI0021680852|nr:mechanosensitive ion channel domain-containing protein [Pedomonas mirosovicensis]MCH8685919.1 mechanosensitive ion channel [Pedomonas mirosovicensis]
MKQYERLMDYPWVERAVDLGLGIVAALLILLIGWYVSGWMSRRARALMLDHIRLDDTVALFLSAVVRYGVMVLVVVMALPKFGVESTSILAVLGAAGLAIGLALQGTLSNIAAGIMLVFLRPMRVGETVEISGIIGTVVNVGLFTTELKRFDGLFVSVPNSQIWSAHIVNYSRNASRRVEVVVGVAYDTDIEQARALLLEEAQALPNALADPAPEVVIAALGQSSIDLSVRVWVPAADYMQTWSFMNRRVKETLESHGIEIPFPQRVLHVVGGHQPAVTAGEKGGRQ